MCVLVCFFHSFFFSFSFSCLFLRHPVQCDRWWDFLSFVMYRTRLRKALTPNASPRRTNSSTLLICVTSGIPVKTSVVPEIPSPIPTSTTPPTPPHPTPPSHTPPPSNLFLTLRGVRPSAPENCVGQKSWSAWTWHQRRSAGEEDKADTPLARSAEVNDDTALCADRARRPS